MRGPNRILKQKEASLCALKKEFEIHQKMEEEVYETFGELFLDISSCQIIDAWRNCKGSRSVGAWEQDDRKRSFVCSSTLTSRSPFASRRRNEVHWTGCSWEGEREKFFASCSEVGGFKLLQKR